MRSMADGQAGGAGLAAIEGALRTALVSDPSPEGLASMDRRFAVALEMAPTPTARKSGSPSRVSRVLLLAAGLFVLAGAAAVALQRFDGWSAPDFDVAWERAAVLGITDQEDGYEVTLERGYADAGQIMLATAVEDLDRRVGVTEVATLSSNWTLVDDRGVKYSQTSAMSGPMSTNESAELLYFFPPTLPLEPGLRHFTLNLDEIGVRDDSLDSAPAGLAAGGTLEAADPWRTVKGPWVFAFDLNVAGGTFFKSDARSAVVRGVTIAVESMLVTPTRVGLGLRVGGLENAGPWDPVEVTARRGSTTIAFAYSERAGDALTYASALQGLDDPSGTWTITIGELVGPAAGPIPTPGDDGSFIDHSQRIHGPWFVEVVVP